MHFQVQSLQKAFENRTVLRGIGFSVEAGEIVGLLGKAGSGKTVLCKAICGQLTFDDGSMELEGNALRGKWFSDVVYVPQKANGQVHSTVKDALSFVLKEKKLSDEEIETRTEELYAQLPLRHMNGKIASLSASQQQLVSLGVAMIQKPKLLVLDDIFAHMDNPTKAFAMGAIYRFAKEEQCGILIASNCGEDVFPLVQKLLLLDNGTIIQGGSPIACYRRPVSLRAASILGDVNFLSGKLLESGGTEALVETEIGSLVGVLARPENEKEIGSEVTVVIRPESWNRSDMPPDENVFRPKVALSVFLGDRADCQLVFEGGAILDARLKNPRSFDLQTDNEIEVWLDPDDVLVF